jgi:hypothetical protein
MARLMCAVRLKRVWAAVQTLGQRLTTVLSGATVLVFKQATVSGDAFMT